MKMTIGIMGSSTSSLDQPAITKMEHLARDLGIAAANHGLIVVTGETCGLPSIVAQAAREAGTLTVGICGASSREEQRERYPLPKPASEVVIYTGFGLKGRNVISVRTADIVIILAGSIGTLNEFTIAYDEGKVIGIVTGTGGIADQVASIIATSPKRSNAALIFNSNPVQLVEDCVQSFRSRGTDAT